MLFRSGCRLSDNDQELIEELLRKLGDKIVVEFTEEAELSDQMLGEIKEKYLGMNVETAIDDYGSGYSNVNNLLRYMPRYVKIDRMLMTNIHEDPQKQHFVKDIIEFAHDNDIVTLAEGVELNKELREVIRLGADICRNIFKRYPGVHVLIFTGEILNEKLWVDVLNAGADGIILKTGELLTKTDVQAVMDGKKLVFNYPILEKIVDRFKQSVANDAKRQEAVISYDIDEYDERFLRHLALGYTKDMIANLKGMPFGVKSLEKRQNDLVNRLFPQGERVGVNATRLVVRALELRILDIDNLEADDE